MNLLGRLYEYGFTPNKTLQVINSSVKLTPEITFGEAFLSRFSAFKLPISHPLPLHTASFYTFTLVLQIAEAGGAQTVRGCIQKFPD
jgi:hypothetical protein